MASAGDKKSYLEWGMYFLIVIYVFCVFNYRDISELVVGLFLVAICFLYLVRKLNEVLKFPFFIFMAAFIVSLITWFLTINQEPDVSSNSPRIELFLLKFAFVPFSFALNNNKKILLLWVLTAIFAFLTPWMIGDGWEGVVEALNGKRSGFGNHIITMGMVYSVILLGLLIFYKRFFLCKYRKTGVLFWIFGVVFSLFGIYASQTRAIYFAFFVLYGLFAIYILYLFVFYREKKFGFIKKFIIVSFLAVLLFFVLGGMGFFDGVKSRFDKECLTILQILFRDYDSVPKNSAGLRIHFWLETWEWIKLRPFFGWGEAANHALHQKAGNYFGDRYFITVHNDVLEVLLSYGIFGLLLFAVFLFWLTIKVNCAWSKSLIKIDFLLFYNIFMVFLIVNSFFMSILYFKESLLLWNIILASYLGMVRELERKKQLETKCLLEKYSCINLRC